MPPQSTINGITNNKVASSDIEQSRLQLGKFLASPPEGEEVVISGLAGQYPDSDNVYHFRDNLYNKVDLVSEDTRRWEHTHPEIPTRGGKLNNIEKFDAGFFGVHFKQAEAMCPMVRLHLERAVECILDAGLHPSELEGANCGVFIGACFAETERTWFIDRLEPKYCGITGCERSMIANRVSYYLKLKGPSFICDTACSSSLYSLEEAYRMIRMGKIDCAIVGGTNVCLHPFVSLQFARLGVLSMDGTCRSFDAAGSGYARSEAICSLFLQKSKDANRIYCQIVHAKTNCDGYKQQGISYPSGEMQKRLLTEFYEESSVNPADVSFLEAHGTGTKVGDPEECAAVDAVFCKDRKEPLRIGAVKSNIGHSEPASGLCSLTKAIIAMENGFIPPNIHFKKPREGVEALERGRLQVVTEKTPFDSDNVLIGINSFGFGGGNCHVLLQWNAKGKKDEGVPRDDIPRLVCVSGRTREAVDSLLDSINSRKLDAEYIRLIQNVFKKHIPGHCFRGYSIISKVGETTRKAEYFSENQEKLYFVFGGIDNEWCSIGKNLFTIPVFAASILKIHNILVKKNINITEIIMNSKQNTTFANSILGNMAIQIGVSDILKAIELKPNNIIGYSFGELACAYSDGALTLEEVVLSTLAIYNATEPICQPLVHYKVALSENQVKQIIPANVEITGIVSEKEVFISGLREPSVTFIKSLKNKGISVENVSTSKVYFLRKDVEKIASQLVQQLKQVISKPKIRSERWVSSIVNGLASAENFVKSLTNPINFKNLIETIPKKAVIFELGSGIFSKITEEHLDIKNGKSMSLVPKQSLYDVEGFLETLGSIHNHGHNFQIHKLYPEIEFPVSRSTPMISPYIKWNHENDWHIFTYKSGDNIKTGARIVLLVPKSNDWKFINGHHIDGRFLMPASGYLIMVWEMMALINNSMTADLAVTFENVKFLRATTIRNDPMEFTVMIQRGTGNFEVIESGACIVTGRIYMTEGSGDQMNLPIYADDDSMKMTTKDVYKELRLRGYNYKGGFRGIEETNLVANKGLIKWEGNWITFIDNMFQMIILNVDSRNLYVPTGIRKLTIDGKKHLLYAQEIGENPKIPVYVYPHCNIIKSGGIEVRGLHANFIPRRKQRGEPVLEKYIFVPNQETMTTSQSVRVNIQICLENISRLKVKAVEVIDESTTEESEPLASLVLGALGDLPMIQPTMKLLTKKQISIPNVTVEDTKLITENDCLLIIGSKLLKRTQVLHAAFGALKDHGFVISREDLNFSIDEVNRSGIDVITIHKTEKEILVMVRKPLEYETPLAVDVSDPKHEFAWLPDLQSAAKDDGHVVVYAQNEQTSGVLGLVNCLRREPGGSRIQCVYIADSSAPKFDVSNPFYRDQLRKNLAINVLKDGKWGTYRHILLENVNQVESEHGYVNVRTRGDLSSLSWIQGPLSFNTKLPAETQLVHIYYSSLNFRDIMTASGRITPDVITMDRKEQECVQGFEFSGRTSTGRRVMGLALCRALATMVKAENYLLYDIPDKWTLEQAATLPVVYTTVLYSLLTIGGAKRGDSVLIHSGAGGVGQAAINIALFYGCKVYTTVGSPEKREFLKKRYPQLTDNYIGNSHETSFEQWIYTETEGRGVDIVLNSLAEEKLMASVRCLARGGRFIEIGKFDLAQNTSLRLALAKRECRFSSVMLDLIFDATPHVKQQLSKVFMDGIAAGAVKPLDTHIFENNEIEQAFRFMASGKHMGKVIIKVRKEEAQKICSPKPMIMKCIPSYLCSEENTYVICGGLGGFGLELADWLILRGAKKVLLTSRSGVRTGYQTYRISLWKSYGADIRVSTANITTRSGCEEMLKEAHMMGPVEAIFNLAVVLKDALFINQTVENFQTSFGPKADATRHLDEVSRRLCPHLKDFVIFSSVSCGRGNPGQTNYGMANSVMERICEKRQQDGLPALAIEWGAVGDVGLVAEMQEEHTELEIGGTLQQRISSCLGILDSFLIQKNVIVSSMVVAEKRAGAGGADNIVDAVANILGLSDLKSVSMHVTLAELGMDSMTAVEIKQTLEREYEVFLTSQDIRSMTFARLNELETERNQTTGQKIEKIPEGIELIIRLIGDEATANIPIMRLPSKVEEGKPAPKILLLPGIEGVATILSPLAKNLNCHALGIQFCHDTPEDTIQEIALSRLPHVLPHLSKKEPFIMLSYSFGSIIALELVALLEKQGYLGKLIVLDGSPKLLLEMMRQQVITESEDQFQTTLLCILMALYMPFETIMANKEKIFRANGFEERMKAAYDCTPEDVPFTPEYQRITAIGIYKRLKGLVKYTPSFTKIKSTIKLFKPKAQSVLNIPEDYDLSQYCEKPVEVRVFDGNHSTILNNLELVDAVNSEIGVSPVFAKEPVIQNGVGKFHIEQVKQI